MPTPVFCCGAECGQNTGNSGHFTASGATASISTSTKRTGNRSFRTNPTAETGYWSTVISSGTPTVGILRTYLYITSAPIVSGVVLAMHDIAASVVELGLAYKTTDSKWYAASDDGITVGFGATGVTINTATWVRVDMKVNVSANPQTCDISIDGVALGQVTLARAASSLLLAVLGAGIVRALNTFDLFHDDILFSVTSVDYPLGAGQGWCGVPTSDGTHNVAGAADFRRGDTTTDITNATTTAFQLVDEVPLDDATPDADDHIRIVAPANVTDYVELVFGPASGFVAITGTINGVEAIGEVFAAGTGLSDEIIRLNDNGTLNIIYDGTAVAGVTTGTYKRKHYATAPSTGIAWTAALVNGIRWRYGYATDANPDKSLMCGMLEVDHVPPAAGLAQSRIVRQAVSRAAVR